MRLTDLGPLPLSIIASLVVAVVLLAIRIFVMQRMQQRRQRENRQETERLKSLVAAYRSLAVRFHRLPGNTNLRSRKRSVTSCSSARCARSNLPLATLARSLAASRSITNL